MSDLRQTLESSVAPRANDNMDEDLRRRVRSLRYRRRGGVVAAVLVVAVCSWGVVDAVMPPARVQIADQPQSPTDEDASVQGDRAWTTLPSAPLSPRWGSFSGWTGEEFVVWGGYANVGTPDEFAANDGAAFDPDTSRWRRLPRAPLAGMYGGGAVWTGEELWILGGVGDPNGREPTAAAAAYTPKDDTWRRLPDVPTHVNAASWSEETNQAVVAGADPATGGVTAWTLAGEGEQWEQLPPLPYSRFDTEDDATFTVVAGGRRAFFVDYDTTFMVDLEHPASWEPLADRPITLAAGAPMAAWTSAGLLIATDGVAALYAIGAQPAEERWRSVPPPPAEWSGEAGLNAANRGRAVAVDTQTGGAAMYDPARSVWAELPRIPLRARARAAVAASGDVDGTRVFVWGGSDDNNLPFADGATLDHAQR